MNNDMPVNDDVVDQQPQPEEPQHIDQTAQTDNDASVQTPEPSIHEPVEKPSPQFLALSPEQLKEIVQGRQNAQPPPQQQPELSPEEFNKRFNVVTVNPREVEQLLYNDTPIEEKAVILQNLLHGAARQAVTMAMHIIQQKEKQFEQVIAPLRSQFAESMESRLVNEFYTAHKDLKPYDALVQHVKMQLIHEGFRGNTKEEVFGELAKRTKSIIAQLSKAGNNAQNGNRKMSSVAPAGSQGSTNSGGGSNNRSLSKGQSIFT